MTKHRLIALIVMLCVFGCAIIAWAQSAKSTYGVTENGRFQLLQGPCTEPTSKGSFDEYRIFRIDTQTGDTWVFLTGLDGNGKLVNCWLRIGN